MSTVPVRQLWSRARDFVASACDRRPRTHGLPHMEQVTQTALLIHYMELAAAPHPSSDGGPCRRDAAIAEQDIVLVGMLHDVNDHKYYSSATEDLEASMRSFLAKELRSDVDAAAALDAIAAVSFSKENKRGKRYFAATLSPRWLRARDIVSDADKIHAIGYDGVLRCWDYGLESWDTTKEALTHDAACRRVLEHAAEKLLRLTDEFIVTASGIHLARPLHHEMEAMLGDWKRNVPTHLPLKV